MTYCKIHVNFNLRYILIIFKIAPLIHIKWTLSIAFFTSMMLEFIWLFLKLLAVIIHGICIRTCEKAATAENTTPPAAMRPTPTAARASAPAGGIRMAPLNEDDLRQRPRGLARIFCNLIAENNSPHRYRGVSTASDDSEGSE